MLQHKLAGQNVRLRFRFCRTLANFRRPLSDDRLLFAVLPEVLHNKSYYKTYHSSSDGVIHRLLPGYFVSSAIQPKLTQHSQRKARFGSSFIMLNQQISRSCPDQRFPYLVTKCILPLVLFLVLFFPASSVFTHSGIHLLTVLSRCNRRQEIKSLLLF